MRKYLSLFRFQISSLRGFTLIELLIVFSILSIISAVSIASFVNYSRTQALKTASLDIIALLQQAKSRAQTQVKPATCGVEPLHGYEVRICGLPGSLCSTPNTFELAVSCGSQKIVTNTRKLPAKVIFTAAGTTSTTYLFRVLNGSVSGAGSVVIGGFNKTQAITVTGQGAISVL